MSVNNVLFEQIKSIADFAPCGIGVFDMETYLPVFFNKAYYALTGYTQDEYAPIAASFDKLLLPADADVAHAGGSVFMKAGEIKDCEYRIVRKDGDIRWVKLDIASVTISGKSCAFACFTDITREKDIASRISLIADNIGSSLSIVKVTGGKEELIYANDAFYRNMNVSSSERGQINMLARALVSGADRDKLSEMTQEALRTGRPGEFTHQYTCPDGTIVWLNRRFAAIKQDTSDSYLLVSIVTDVTEKKNAELRAALEQHRYKEVIRELNAAVFEWNFHDKSFYMSEAYEKYAISQVDPEDILKNRAPMDLVHPDDHGALLDFFRRTDEQPEHTEVVLRLKMVAGGYHWCRMVAMFIKDKNGLPYRTIGVIIDINDEHERSFMLSGLLNEMPGGVGIFAFGEKLICQYFSDGFAAISGRTRAEVERLISEGTLLDEVLAPADHDRVLNALARNARDGKPISLTYRYNKKDKTSGWLHLSATKMREENGLPVYYCVFTNPTDETALYRSVVEDSPIGVLVAETSSRSILYINDAVRNLCGFSHADELSGRSMVDLLENNGIKPLIKQEILESLKTDEYTELHLSESGHYLEVKAKALLWNGVESYILYISDETKEHDRQVQLQKLIDEVPTGIGIYDVRDGKVSMAYLNDAYYELLGVTRGSRQDFAGERAVEAVHPDDRPRLMALIHQLVSGEKKASVLLRLLCRDDKWTWFTLNGSVVERREGNIRIYAAFSDCDEMVRAQQYAETMRRREQALMASIPGGVAIYRLKKSGIVVTEYISEGLARMCGYTYEEFFAYLKDNAMKNVPEEDIPKVMKAAQHSLETGQPVSVIYHIHRKGQPDILNRLDANLIEDAEIGEDDLAVWYAVHTYVSDDSKIALAEQEHYRTVLNMTGIAYFEWDSNSGFYSSAKFDEYAISREGFSAIMGSKNGVETIYPDDRIVLQNYVHDIDNDRRDSSVKVRMKMCDGSFRWTEITGYVERDEGGRLSRIIGIMRDMDNEWIEQNIRLQKALTEAQNANQAKSAFLSRMSHDMRTPLNGMLGLAHLMKSAISDENVLNDLAQMEISGQYLLNLINDTLDVSRIETGKLELHPSVCDGRAIFESVIALAKPTIDAKHIHASVKTTGLTYPMLYIDIGRVEQVMMNILGNAVKFTPEGGSVSCTMTNVSTNDGVIIDRICIEDNGVGMKSDFLPHIFEPFSQEDNSKKNSRQGTGLGMIITKQLVELMGGTISVESEPGKGTRVTFTLALPIATPEQVTAWKLTQHQTVESFSFAGKRILLCEDHPLNAKIAMRILAKKGIKIDHAQDGRQGLEMFKASPDGWYDAILMDIRMPEMDGLETTAVIRQLRRVDAKTIPIIAMTANAFDDDVRDTKNAGMDAHLSKPIEPQKLFAVLGEVLKTGHRDRRPRILVVDDNEVNRIVIVENLRDEYNVVETDSGAEALGILNNDHYFDAVITDIQMPGMGGAELIRSIRSNPDLKNVKIIANTQFGDRNQEKSLLEIGANEFIYKPTSPDIVRIRIHNALKDI